MDSSYAGKNTVKYELLKKKRGRIIEVLAVRCEPGSLSDKLDEMITEDVRAMALVILASRTDRIRPMIDAVISKVEFDTDNYKKFISILSGITGLEDLVKFIEDPVDTVSADLVKSKPSDKRDTGERDIERAVIKVLEEMQKEETVTYSHAAIKYLKFIDETRGLHEISECGVVNYKIVTQENTLSLFGSPANIFKAKDEVGKILQSRKIKRDIIPPEVSVDALQKYQLRCQTKQKVLISVSEKERILEISAEDDATCTEAMMWMKNVIYPQALCITRKDCRYVQRPVRCNNGTVLRSREVSHDYCEANLRHSKDGGCTYFSVELPRPIFERAERDRVKDTHASSIQGKLKEHFKKLERFQKGFKVGYEARFGCMYWKSSMQPVPQQTVGSITSCGSKFNARVTTDIQAVLDKFTERMHSSVALIDPLKVVVKTANGEEVDCVAVVQQHLDDGTFRLNNVYFPQKQKCNFDIIFPHKNYDIRIAPNCAPVTQKELHAEEWGIIEAMVITGMHTRSDHSVEMELSGESYCVKFVRKKKQTQHVWKDNEHWILAEYDVQQFEMEGEIKFQRSDLVQPFKDAPKKKEIELWNRKIFGDFASTAQLTTSQYAVAQGTVDLHLPLEDDVRRGSTWTADDIMKDFLKFVDAAVDIVDTLPPYQD